MAWTLTTSGAAIVRAGNNSRTNINTTGDSLTWDELSTLSNDAEGFIETETRRKWVDNYSSLSTSIKNRLSEVCSAHIAMAICAHDITGYFYGEAQLIMNQNNNLVESGIRFLKDIQKSTELKDP